MYNLCSDRYPILSPRSKRGIHANTTNAAGLIEKDSLCYVEDGAFYINGSPVLDFSLDANTEKTLVSMGAYVLIFPDKKYINTADITDKGNIEQEFVTEGTVAFELCKIDANLYADNIPSQPNEPENPNNLDLWIDTSSVPNSLKQYSAINAAWVAIPTTYVKISAVGIGKNFNVYDGVKISGITIEGLQDLNNTMVIWDKGDDYIVVIGLVERRFEQEEAVTITRMMPDMDFVTESGNRLWGCKFGFSETANAVVNEIYCSKLGDFKNWNCFMGLSTDSYAVSLGTDGHFTGAVTHMGYPIFFKENNMHKIYGNFPSNFQVQTTECRGVQAGSHKSLAIVNEMLFYLSRGGVCVYDGSLPSSIAEKFGEVKYTDGVAGALDNKYYISMKDSNDKRFLFVFDSAKGLWHKEDNLDVMQFCSCRGELYYIDNADKMIKSILGTGVKDITDIEWFAETGQIALEIDEKKYISKINIKLSLNVKSKARLLIEYDSSGVWQELWVMRAVSLKTFSVPIKPKRCDHFRLRIEGIGDANLYSITQTIQQGSDT